jgi:hypothetical protein
MAEPQALGIWLLEQEARALLRRLDRVKPFALQETMVPAASLLPSAQLAIERYLLEGRRRLRKDVGALITWLRGPGRTAPASEQQRRYTIIRLGFNTALAQLDLFSDAVTQRSESETGVWLSGLDVAARDALVLGGDYYEVPPVVCYLDRGLGGAIRRAHTRLPGGGTNPAAVIRIPRERMIGFGIASSLVHEAGHQGAALLELVPSLKLALQERGRTAPPVERTAWRYWDRTISETIADTWALGRVGVSSTLGLMGIVSLPRPFVFRVDLSDPHPFPWIRVLVSCAIGDAFYPHPQWQQLAATWQHLYPPRDLGAERAALIASLRGTIPALAELIASHRPASLHQRSLVEVLADPARTPAALLATYQRWQAEPRRMETAPPTLVFAVFGRARITGHLSPEAEERLLARLITRWAVESTFESANPRAAIGPSQAVPAAAPQLPRSALAARIA